MQCFRCGKDLPGSDYTCFACGAQLSFGETVCRQCGTAMLCDDCGGAAGGTTSGSASTATPSDQLHYEYMTVQIPIHLTRGEHESYDSYAQRVREVLVEQTQPATLEGWQTADPLDYAWLQSHGFVERSLWNPFGWSKVTIRLKRLIKS